MMGDNRDNSEDSRYWGFMPATYVKGKALFIYFSLDEAPSKSFAGIAWGRILNTVR
jgi:signal peptidase I